MKPVLAALIGMSCGLAAGIAFGCWGSRPGGLLDSGIPSADGNRERLETSGNTGTRRPDRSKSGSHARHDSVAGDDAGAVPKEQPVFDDTAESLISILRNHGASERSIEYAAYAWIRFNVPPWTECSSEEMDAWMNEELEKLLGREEGRLAFARHERGDDPLGMWMPAWLNGAEKSEILTLNDEKSLLLVSGKSWVEADKLWRDKLRSLLGNERFCDYLLDVSEDWGRWNPGDAKKALQLAGVGQDDMRHFVLIEVEYADLEAESPDSIDQAESERAKIARDTRQKNLLGTKYDAFKMYSDHLYRRIKEALEKSGSLAKPEVVYGQVCRWQARVDSAAVWEESRRLANEAHAELGYLYPGVWKNSVPPVSISSVSSFRPAGR